MEVNLLTNASLSTMWALKNYPDLNGFFNASRKLGFQKIELNHQVDSTMLQDVSLDHVQFSGIHEPCPADISTRDLVDRDWLISSVDEPSRKQGVASVRKTIDLAHKLNAPVVILHCGTIPSTANYESKLRALFKAGKSGSGEYQQAKSQIIQYREEHIGPRLQAVTQSILELVEYASHFQVKIGLENRYHYLDLPSIDEMGQLLQLSGRTQLGYIYDVGHAQALDRLGFYPHEDWLKRYSDRMFGVHLHDVLGLVDHYAPGLGEIDFKKIVDYIPESAFRTLEVLPANTYEQVKQGLHTLAEHGCVSYV